MIQTNESISKEEWVIKGWDDELQQLRYVGNRSQGLNRPGRRCPHTSPARIVSQIRELELELGVDIFDRRGKRFTA
jgi:DNA-binding transcriptional LysR family regulator